MKLITLKFFLRDLEKLFILEYQDKVGHAFEVWTFYSKKNSFLRTTSFLICWGKGYLLPWARVFNAINITVERQARRVLDQVKACRPDRLKKLTTESAEEADNHIGWRSRKVIRANILIHSNSNMLGVSARCSYVSIKVLMVLVSAYVRGLYKNAIWALSYVHSVTDTPSAD